MPGIKAGIPGYFYVHHLIPEFPSLPPLIPGALRTALMPTQRD